MPTGHISTGNTPSKNTPQKELFASKSLLVLKNEWFNNHEFVIGIFILDKKYKHPELKYKNTFYLLNDQFNHVLVYYFVKSKKTKGNINKVLIDLLMAFLTKKLLYKNADK